MRLGGAPKRNLHGVGRKHVVRSTPDVGQGYDGEPCLKVLMDPVGGQKGACELWSEFPICLWSIWENGTWGQLTSFGTKATELTKCLHALCSNFAFSPNGCGSRNR